jgi:hypothetical protein
MWWGSRLPMILGIFGTGKQPPLTAACAKLSAPENLLAVADRMSAGRSSSADKRAVVLSLVIMGAAGHFVVGLRWDRQKAVWEGSRRYLRETNLDVITAEAVAWMHFLMGQFWRADQKDDPAMFERIGFVTVSEAMRLALYMIKEHTGFDFKARALESRRVYLDAMKDKSVSFEPFATTVLRCVGCRSLAEPLKPADALLTPEWTPLSVNVGIFFSTMPSAFYETFKNFLREWPDRFPHDDDDWDE